MSECKKLSSNHLLRHEPAASTFASAASIFASGAASVAEPQSCWSSTAKGNQSTNTGKRTVISWIARETFRYQVHLFSEVAGQCKPNITIHIYKYTSMQVKHVQSRQDVSKYKDLHTSRSPFGRFVTQTPHKMYSSSWRQTKRWLLESTLHNSWIVCGWMGLMWFDNVWWDNALSYTFTHVQLITCTCLLFKILCRSGERTCEMCWDWNHLALLPDFRLQFQSLAYEPNWTTGQLMQVGMLAGCCALWKKKRQ